MNNNLKNQDLIDRIEKLCNLLHDKKATDILAINITDKTIIADYMVICSGRSNVQVKSLCDEIESVLGAEMGLLRKEGYSEGRWIVLDFGDILLHIFHPEERTYYSLERIWADDQNVTDYSASKK